MLFRSALLCLSLTALLSSTATAGSDEIRILSKAQASRVMYDAGMEAQDALMVIAAAKLRRSLGMAQTSRSAEGSEPVKGTPLDWETMLADAGVLAIGDDLLFELIEDVEAERSKGVVNGPVYNIGKLDGKSSDTYANLQLEAGTYAEVYIEARDDSDMNLFIFDAQGRLVCSDTDSSAIAYCGFRPKISASFSVKVTNESPNTAQYSLITN